MKNGKVDLKFNPLDPEIKERIVEELTAGREMAEDVKKAQDKQKRDASPIILQARIEKLEQDVKDLTRVAKLQSGMIGRLITIVEKNQ